MVSICLIDVHQSSNAPKFYFLCIQSVTTNSYRVQMRNFKFIRYFLFVGMIVLCLVQNLENFWALTRVQSHLNQEATERINSTMFKETTINAAVIGNPSDDVSIHYIFVPEIPDLSIGEMLRDIIPDANHTFPLSFCSPTSQLKIIITTTTRTHGNGTENDKNMRHRNESISYFQKWNVETYDEYGKRKTIGGDEFQVSFLHDGIPKNKDMIFKPSAIAIPTDNNDGTYTLDFVTPSLSSDTCVESCSSFGTLKVDMVYTCSIGRMTRPSKDNWKHGGYLREKTYFIKNVSAPESIKTFEGPNSNGLIDLSKFDKVICFGDSLMGNLCGVWWDKYIFKKKNIEFIRNVGSSVRSDLLMNETFPLLEELHGKDLRTSRHPGSTAIILGSAAWEMSANLGPYPGHFFNHSLDMYRDLVTGVRERYPNVTIFWKSPQAVHLTVLQEDCYKEDRKCVDRVRYISNSIALYLHQEQTRIMKMLNVTVLDVFNATYLGEIWHMEGDCQHYRHWLNRHLLDYFHPKPIPPSSSKRRLRMMLDLSRMDDNDETIYYRNQYSWWETNSI